MAAETFSPISEAIFRAWREGRPPFYAVADRKLEPLVGGNSIGFVPPENPDLVVNFPYKGLTADEAHFIFYAHQVLKTLFPLNFPTIYAAIPNDPDGKKPAGTIRQRIIGMQLESEAISDIRQYDETGLTHPFRYILQVSRSLQLPVRYDLRGQNFIITGNGSNYYVDTVESERGNWNVSNIVNFMTQTGRQRGEIEQLVHALSALGVRK